jgi:hypothetical protein
MSDLEQKIPLEGLMLWFPNCAEVWHHVLFQNIVFFFQFMCIMLSKGY